MAGETETAATRLWRDRVRLREQERDDALARARIAEEKVTLLNAENDRLAGELTQFHAQHAPDAQRARAETEAQMEAVRQALLPLLASGDPDPASP